METPFPVGGSPTPDQMRNRWKSRLTFTTAHSSESVGVQLEDSEAWNGPTHDGGKIVMNFGEITVVEVRNGK